MAKETPINFKAPAGTKLDMVPNPGMGARVPNPGKLTPKPRTTGGIANAKTVNPVYKTY